MDAAEVGRRVRAARAYAFGADRGRTEVAQAINVSTRTLSRIESGRREISADEQAAIARACHLDPHFFTLDFAGEPPDEIDARTRLQNAETQLAAIWATLSRLEDRTRQLESEARERDKELLERELEAAGERAETPPGRSAAGQAHRGARG